MRVSIEAIGIGDRIRPVCEEQAGALAADMQENGLREPILICRVENGDFEVLSGAHRLRAAQILGWSEIEATVLTVSNEEQRTLAETNANLMRVGNTLLAQAQALRAGQLAYNKIHNTGYGGDRRSKKFQDGKVCHLENKNTSAPFVAIVSRIQGVSRRTLDNYIKLAKDLGDECCDKILAAGLEIADHGSHLKLLGRQEKHIRLELINLLIKKKNLDFMDGLTAVLTAAANDNSETAENAEQIAIRQEKQNLKEIARITNSFSNKLNLVQRRELIHRLLENDFHTLSSALEYNGYCLIKKSQQGAA